MNIEFKLLQLGISVMDGKQKEITCVICGHFTSRFFLSKALLMQKQLGTLVRNLFNDDFEAYLLRVVVTEITLVVSVGMSVIFDFPQKFLNIFKS